MRNEKFDVGTIIKGKDLRGVILCKIFSEDIKEDINLFEEKHDKGIRFYTLKEFCKYLDYGNKIAYMSISDEEDVYVDASTFYALRLEIKKIMPLNESTTWMYLHNNGVDITAMNNYSVVWAAKNGYLEVMKYLHENGVDITSRNNEAIQIAAENGHLEVVRYLHENGADITAKNNHSYKSLVVGYKTTFICGHDMEGDNYAVRWASGKGHLEVVKYLHQNGADITAGNNHAIRLAAENGYFEIVKYLHQSGADVTADDNAAVIDAAKNGYLDIVKYLHENGADITARDNEVIFWAVEGGYLDIVKYLYENGAKITARNNEAILWAAENGYTDVVEYLQANM